MKLEEVLPALRKGKKIRRADVNWQNDYGFIFIKNGKIIFIKGSEIIFNSKKKKKYVIDEEDLNADDWEIVKETKKVKLRDLTPEQFKNWYKNTCYKLGCEECIFYRVPCAYDTINCWVRNKDLYRDKFLDQEIEIEE